MAIFRLIAGALITHICLKIVHHNIFVQSSNAIRDYQLFLKKKVYLFDVDKPAHFSSNLNFIIQWMRIL